MLYVAWLFSKNPIKKLLTLQPAKSLVPRLQRRLARTLNKMRCRSLRGFYGAFLVNSPEDNGGGGGVMH